MQTKSLKSVLKTLTSVIKFDKTRPITALVGVEAEDGVCYFSATDLQTNIVGRIECKEIIKATTVSLVDFYQLVKSFKGKELSIRQDKDCLQLECDGKYKLPYKKDIDGTVVNLPVNIIKMDNLIEVKDFDKVYKKNKAAMNEDTLPVMKFNNNMCYTTDGDILIVTNFNIKDGEMPTQIAGKLASLGSDFQVGIKDGRLYAKTENIAMSSHWGKLNEFPLKETEAFIDVATLAKTDGTKLLEIVRRFKSLKKKNIVFISKYNSLAIHDIDMTIEEGVEYQGTLNDTTIVFDTDAILKVLRVVDREITFGLYSKFMAIKDFSSSYAISGGSE